MHQICFNTKALKLCNKQVNLIYCTTYEQAVVVGKHAIDEFNKRHPLGVPRKEGVTDGMIKTWIKEVRDSSEKVAEQWAKDNAEAIVAAGDVKTYEQQSKIPCAYCNGASEEDGGCGITYVTSKQHDMRYFASPVCALKALGYIRLPSGEEYCEDIKSDDGALKVVTRGISHDNGNWTVSSGGYLCPTWEERLLEEYRDTEEGRAAVEKAIGLNENVPYDSAKKAAYYLEVTKPRRAADSAKAKKDGDDCLKFDDYDIEQPEYDSASDIVNKQRKLAREKFSSKEYVLAYYAWKGTADLVGGSFVVRDKEQLSNTTAYGRPNVILCPNNDNKTGTNFKKPQFILVGELAASWNSNFIPYTTTFDVYESNPDAFRREAELTSALKDLSDMSNPSVPEVVINDTGGGNGGKAKKPGFPVAGLAIMAFRKGQFGFNVSRSLSKELVSKLPEDCRLVLKMDASKQALVDNEKKWREDRKVEKAAAKTRRAKAKLVTMFSEVCVVVCIYLCCDLYRATTNSVCINVLICRNKPAWCLRIPQQ